MYSVHRKHYKLLCVCEVQKYVALQGAKTERGGGGAYARHWIVGHVWHPSESKSNNIAKGDQEGRNLEKTASAGCLKSQVSIQKTFCTCSHLKPDPTHQPDAVGLVVHVGSGADQKLGHGDVGIFLGRVHAGVE